MKFTNYYLIGRIGPSYLVNGPQMQMGTNWSIDVYRRTLNWLGGFLHSARLCRVTHRDYEYSLFFISLSFFFLFFLFRVFVTILLFNLLVCFSPSFFISFFQFCFLSFFLSIFLSFFLSFLSFSFFYSFLIRSNIYLSFFFSTQDFIRVFVFSSPCHIPSFIFVLVSHSMYPSIHQTFSVFFRKRTWGCFFVFKVF